MFLLLSPDVVKFCEREKFPIPTTVDALILNIYCAKGARRILFHKKVNLFKKIICCLLRFLAVIFVIEVKKV